MTDLEYIKSVSKRINISAICRKLNINYTNLISGRTSKKNESRVRKEIESEFAKLYVIPENKEEGK